MTSNLIYNSKDVFNETTYYRRFAFHCDRQVAPHLAFPHFDTLGGWTIHLTPEVVAGTNKALSCMWGTGDQDAFRAMMRWAVDQVNLTRVHCSSHLVTSWPCLEN